MKIFDVYGTTLSDVDDVSMLLNNLLGLSFVKRHSSYIGNYCSWLGDSCSVEIRPNAEIDCGEVYLRKPDFPFYTVLIFINTMPNMDSIRDVLSKVENIFFLERESILS